MDSPGLGRKIPPFNIDPRYVYLRDSIEYMVKEDFVEGDLIEEDCFSRDRPRYSLLDIYIWIPSRLENHGIRLGQLDVAPNPEMVSCIDSIVF